MFPTSPYPGHGWALNHHMGKVNPQSLYYFLLAAAANSDNPDPVLTINQLLASSGILTHNVRQDTGQPETWRDYQQILSDLGLIYSTKATRRQIVLTPLGMAFLDGAMSYSEVMTLQSLRCQYPNGQNFQIHPSLKAMLQGTAFATARPLSRVQYLAGVQIRPAVLCWRVIRQLQQQGQSPTLTTEEIDRYVIRCATHAETALCVSAIIDARQGGVALPRVSDTRDAVERGPQEWVRFLQRTLFFAGEDDGIPEDELHFSAYAVAQAEEIDSICAGLEDPNSFWVPQTFDRNDRLDWFGWYGSLDASARYIPDTGVALPENEEFPEGREDEHEKELATASSIGQIQLREFDPSTFLQLDREVRNSTGTTIDSSYDAALAQRQHRLHDQMVLLIAATCRAKGAEIWDDPNSVDLLVRYQALEFLVEVKSVTRRNFIVRLRHALGQVLYYDYLRSLQSQAGRRRVIAVAAHVPADAWCISFLNTHVDVDLLSLNGRVLEVHSALPTTRQLFSPM